MLNSKICKNCKEIFFTRFSRKKYCSKKCKKEVGNEISLERAKELREISIEIGNCTFCYKPKEDPKYRHCFKCREYHRLYKRRIKKK